LGNIGRQGLRGEKKSLRIRLYSITSTVGFFT